MVALLGTNGAGKSTLLRAVSGLDHPHRGVIRLFGMNSTYLEPEQIIDQGVALLVGGKMTFPGLTVRDNLRIGGTRCVVTGPGSPRPKRRRWSLSRIAGPPGPTGRHPLGGRAADARPLAGDDDGAPAPDDRRAGAGPRSHDGRTTHGDGAADQRDRHDGHPGRAEPQPCAEPGRRCFFMERGEIRFDGPTADLMARDDLLRPVFLGAASTGLG